MALLLNDIVVCGQISNRQRNSVRGWLKLRGFEHRLWISLTGNFAEDLFGKSFFFEAMETARVNGVTSSALAKLAPRQIGPAGTMTASGRIQVAHYSPEDLLACQLIGAAPPLQWKSSLFLEWFSQNGRVIVELLDARITFVDDLLEDPGMDESDDYLWDEVELWDDEPADEDDPYGLFPADLEERLATPAEDAEPFDTLDESPLNSTSLFPGDEMPLHQLFDPPIKLFPPNQLTDRQIDESLQVLLARLARHGVALDMCEHFTPRNAYRLLLEQILPNESIPAKLAESGFVQQYTTHEFCPICLLQFMEDEPLDEDERDSRRDAHRDDENP